LLRLAWMLHGGCMMHRKGLPTEPGLPQVWPTPWTCRSRRRRRRPPRRRARPAGAAAAALAATGAGNRRRRAAAAMRWRRLRPPCWARRSFCAARHADASQPSRYSVHAMRHLRGVCDGAACPRRQRGRDACAQAHASKPPGSSCKADAGRYGGEASRLCGGLECDGLHAAPGVQTWLIHPCMPLTRPSRSMASMRRSARRAPHRLACSLVLQGCSDPARIQRLHRAAPNAARSCRATGEQRRAGPAQAGGVGRVAHGRRLAGRAPDHLQ